MSRRARHAAARARDVRLVAAAVGAANRLDVRVHAGRFTREVSLTLAAVLLLGVAAAGTQPEQAPRARLAAAPAAAAVPSPEPTQGPTTTTGLAARAPDLTVPSPTPPAPKPLAAPEPAAAPAPVKRWLPTGTGMWLHDWRRSEGGRAADVVARAQKVGLTHLYVQTGSSRKGWIGAEVLSELMPAVKGTDLKVIAWDFPKLNDPEADARRMARAAWWNRPGAEMVSAVAPDVETGAEGTNLRGDRVQRYYAELRKRLPARIAILATVPWPSEKRTGSYPYAATAPFADAFIPMAYWYNRSPSTVTATSMTYLKRFGKPVMPVGQGYDGRLDAPYLKPDPAPDKSVARFVFVARQNGAQSISLWSWQTTGPLQWGVLAKAAGTVGPQPAPKLPAQPVVPTPSPAEVSAEQERADEAKEKAPGRKRDRTKSKRD